MDLNDDGVIDSIPDGLLIAASYPQRCSGSFVWHGESDFVDGAIPGDVLRRAGGTPLPGYGTPGVQAFLQGLAARIPNGTLTESVETSYGAHGTWGIAGVGAHQSKAASSSQADATLRAQNVAAFLVAGFDVKAKSAAPRWRNRARSPRGRPRRRRTLQPGNDYDIGAKTGAAFSSHPMRPVKSRGSARATSVADGTLLFIQNAGSYTLTLKDESASSTAANRFAFPTRFADWPRMPRASSSTTLRRPAGDDRPREARA